MTQSSFAKSGLAKQGVQVVVQHSPLVDQALSPEMRTVTLLFVVPPKNSVRSFAKQLQAQLKTEAVPRLTAQPAGELLPEAMSIAEAHRRWNAGRRRMQVSVSFP